MISERLRWTDSKTWCMTMYSMPRSQLDVKQWNKQCTYSRHILIINERLWWTAGKIWCVMMYIYNIVYMYLFYSRHIHIICWEIMTNCGQNLMYDDLHTCIHYLIPGTYTLSVRDYDELRGYLAKHYKIVTRRPPDHSCELYYITKSRTFTSLPDLVKHYQGTSRKSRS